MTSRRLNILAISSAFVIALCLPGYLGICSLSKFSPPTPTSQTYWALSIDDGRIRWLHAQFIAPQPPTAGMLWHCRLIPKGLPRLDRWFAGFDCHSLQPAIGNGTAFIFGFPLWCIELPCAIAPIRWILKRRRQRRTDRGFAVLPATQTT